MNELLFGSGTSPLLAYGKQYPLQVLIGVVVLAQFAILALHMIFGDKQARDERRRYRRLGFRRWRR
jgi:hypothetical protein